LANWRPPMKNGSVSPFWLWTLHLDNAALVSSRKQPPRYPTKYIHQYTPFVRPISRIYRVHIFNRRLWFEVCALFMSEVCVELLITFWPLAVPSTVSTVIDLFFLNDFLPMATGGANTHSLGSVSVRFCCICIFEAVAHHHLSSLQI